MTFNEEPRPSYARERVHQAGLRRDALKGEYDERPPPARAAEAHCNEVQDTRYDVGEMRDEAASWRWTGREREMWIRQVLVGSWLMKMVWPVRVAAWIWRRLMFRTTFIAITDRKSVV